MTYVIAYFSIGLLAFIGIGMEKYLSEKRSKWNKISDVVRRANMTPVQRFLDRFVVPTLVVLLIIVAWPLAIILAIKFYRNDKAPVLDLDLSAPKEFAVQREHLIEPLTLEDIEYREIVHDPLNAVPAEPFGHFYQAWERFREQIAPAEQLWSFKAISRRNEWNKEIQCGYTVVAGERIGPFFVGKIASKL